MPVFSIQHGATPLCRLDVGSGTLTFHKERDHPDEVLVVEESEKVNFVLAPQTEGMEYRIFIGDVPLSDLLPAPDDASGAEMAGQLIWRRWPYFESARGHTRLLLEAQPEGSPNDRWQRVLALDVFVLPTKLGEDRYDRMAQDLQDLSRSLLVDLYGKSRQTHDVRYAKEGRAHTSREQELASINDVLGRLSVLLAAIGARPASRVIAESSLKQFWGSERLSPSAVTAMCRTGLSPRRAHRPLSVRGQRKVESFDISEHRVTRAFLEILKRRAHYCANVALEHMRAIDSERYLRHIRCGDQPTLYEKVDLPKIRRLRGAVTNAERAISVAENLAALPFLRHVRPELVAVRGGTFQRGRDYQLLLSLIRCFLLANAVWYQGHEMSEVTKLTSRLYEQWCYLKIIEAFRQCGLDLREWTDALRQNLRSRFILDFDRGLTFEGALTAGLRLRFRYEPWILGIESALKAGETLCRGSITDVAWSPDIVIECLARSGNAWHPVYAIVLDCKYKSTHQQFDEIIKYQEIRSTRKRRQVVKQLWLISPPPPDVPSAITSEDPALLFDEGGPSCAPEETVRFRLTVAPGVENPLWTAGAARPDAFQKLAQGTMNFLRREFGPKATSLPAGAS
jgi:hypothetical protein